MRHVESVLAFLVSFVGNPLSMWLAIHRNPFGWWIVAVTQTLFVGYALASGHWQFGGQVLCLAMGLYGVWRWSIRRTHEPALDKRSKPKPSGEPSRKPDRTQAAG
ncbi:hypothetical protein [Flindersiella endophytica]